MSPDCDQIYIFVIRELIKRFRTPVECLEGIHADHYTTNAMISAA